MLIYVYRNQSSAPFSNIFSPSDQEHGSIISSRLLPLPPSLIPQRPWLHGSAMSSPVHNAPRLGNLEPTLVTSNRLEGAIPTHRAPTAYAEPPYRWSIASKLSRFSPEDQTFPVLCRGSDSHRDPVKRQCRHTSNKPAQERSRSFVDNPEESQQMLPTSKKRDLHKTADRESHKLAERERRSVCSATIHRIKMQLLPNLLPEHSPSSHKLGAARNDVLVYSLAHIVCLMEECDVLATENDVLTQKYASERNALVERIEHHKVQYTVTQLQLDALRKISPGRGHRNTPPASSPPSPNTFKQGDLGILDGDDEVKQSIKARSSSRKFPPPIYTRQRIWKSEVIDKIKKFLTYESDTRTDAPKPTRKKRKRSASDSTLTMERSSE